MESSSVTTEAGEGQAAGNTKVWEEWARQRKQMDESRQQRMYDTMAASKPQGHSGLGFSGGESGEKRPASAMENTLADTGAPAAATPAALLSVDSAKLKAQEIAQRLTANLGPKANAMMNFGGDQKRVRVESAPRIEEKIFIPYRENPEVNFPGLIIGPRGSGQKKIESETGAKVKILGKGSSREFKNNPELDPNEEDMHVHICAETQESVDAAAKIIRSILFDEEVRERTKREQLRMNAELNGRPWNDSPPAQNQTTPQAGMGGGMGGGMGMAGGMGMQMGMPEGDMPGQTSKKITVPQRSVGLIIGRGGENIRFLQAKIGARIQVVKEDNVDPNTLAERDILLAGSTEAVERAEKSIWEIVSQIKDDGTGLKPTEQVTVDIPSNKVGLVIGRGGEMIRSLQERSKAKIHIEQDVTDGPERKIHISGTSLQVEEAKTLIEELLKGSEMRQGMRGAGGGGAGRGYYGNQMGYGGYDQYNYYGNYGYAGYGGYPQQGYDYSQYYQNYYGQQQQQAAGQPTSAPAATAPTNTGYDYSQYYAQYQNYYNSYYGQGNAAASGTPEAPGAVPPGQEGIEGAPPPAATQAQDQAQDQAQAEAQAQAQAPPPGTT